jgi:acylphosphatase
VTVQEISMPAIARHLIIEGLVQSVGFRGSMAAEAETLGVAGWVRNRREGSVEAMLEGDEEAVIALVAWARRGPRSARVDRVRVEIGETGWRAFEQRPTA